MNTTSTKPTTTEAVQERVTSSEGPDSEHVAAVLNDVIRTIAVANARFDIVKCTFMVLGCIGNSLGLLTFTKSRCFQTPHFLYYKVMCVAELTYALVSFADLSIKYTATHPLGTNVTCCAWCKRMQTCYDYAFFAYVAGIWVQFIYSTAGYMVMYMSVFVAAERLIAFRRRRSYMRISNYRKRKAASWAIAVAMVLSSLVHSWDRLARIVIKQTYLFHTDRMKALRGAPVYTKFLRNYSYEAKQLRDAKESYNHAVRLSYPVVLFGMTALVVVKWRELQRRHGRVRSQAAQRHTAIDTNYVSVNNNNTNKSPLNQQLNRHDHHQHPHSHHHQRKGSRCSGHKEKNGAGRCAEGTKRGGGGCSSRPGSASASSCSTISASASNNSKLAATPLAGTTHRHPPLVAPERPVRSRRELSLFYLMLLIVMLAFICVIPREIVRIFEFIYPPPPTLEQTTIGNKTAESAHGNQTTTPTMSPEERLTEVKLQYIKSILTLVSRFVNWMDVSLKFYIYISFNAHFRGEFVKAARGSMLACRRRRTANDHPAAQRKMSGAASPALRTTDSISGFTTWNSHSTWRVMPQSDGSGNMQQ